MLCPKCGFISFDHFLVCVKCRADLSQVGMELHGTTTDVECRHYLRLVLKDTEASPAETEIQQEMPTVALVEDIVELPEDQHEGDAGGEERAGLLLVDDSPGLEFDIDEIPSLDISDFEGGEAEDSRAEEVSGALPPQEELVLVDQASPPPVPPSSAGEAERPVEETLMEIDTLCLDLQDAMPQEADGPPPESTPASGAVEPSAHLAATLHEIDLSDLVHDVGESGAKDGAEASAGGLDFEDTMDLSLFIGETESPPASFPSPERGVEPIDLTLVDDALVDLAVDPSRKEQPTPQGESSAGLDELRMDDPSEG